MLALWQILPERSGRPIMRPTCRHRPARSVSFEKPTRIIGVVEDKKPLSVALISQPAANELEYVRLYVLPARDLDVVCDFPTTLFEPGGVARMYPKNPCLRRLASNLVGELNSKLRLPWCVSAVRPILTFFLHTQPRLSQRQLSWRPVRHTFREAD
jgi:hypothetical protein